METQAASYAGLTMIRMHDVFLIVLSVVTGIIASYTLLALADRMANWRRTEAALRESEAQLLAIFAAMDDLIFVMDSDGRYLQIAPTNPNLLYKPSSELIGKTLHEVFPHSQADIFLYHIRRALDACETVHIEYSLHIDGAEVWFTGAISPMLTDSVVFVCHNMTERKQAEEALKKSQQKLALHVQHTPLAVIEWSDDYEIKEWNPAAEAIFGYSKAEAVGQNGAKLLIPESAKEHVNNIKSKLLLQTDGTRSTNENLTKDGRTIICEWYNTPLIDQNGGVIGVASLAQDITERKRSELELQTAKETAEAANRAKSEFLANMSHEIRTPMNGVIGMTELLLNTELTPQQQEFITTIRSCSSALLTIINDILNFSKIESGKLELEKQPLHLQTCIEEALNLLTCKASEKNLRLVYLIDPSTPNIIMGDVTRLCQILINLIGNAVKFTATGEVAVSVTAQKQNSEFSSDSFYEIQFAVKDTGIGIPADRMDRLFKSFSQVDSSITRQYGGTGLGLSISKRLCEMMGGRIWVESQVGFGSTFYFTIVAQPAPETRQIEKQSFQQQKEKCLLHAQTHPLRILLAEDNTVNQKVAEHILQQMGYQADIASNGLEVLEALRRQPYDVVLMDVQMPEMDGLTATRYICQEWPQARPRIIALTANAMQSDRACCFEAGMDDYLSKPLRVDELVEALSRCQPMQAEVQRCTSAEEINFSFSEVAPLLRSSSLASVDGKALQGLRDLASENDSSFLATVIAAFLEDAPKLLQVMDEAIACCDALALQQAAHTLKSSSAVLGATTLSQLCKQLEALGRTGTTEGGVSTMISLTAEYERVKAALQTELRGCHL